MNRVFADSFFYFAIVNPDDQDHRRAIDFLSSFDGQIVTTSWVLVELGDGMCDPRNREPFLQLYRDLAEDPQVFIVPPDQEYFEAGLELFARRQDKAWSLTDCISFAVMQREGLTEALTADHHFEQAGFVALLK